MSALIDFASMTTEKAIILFSKKFEQLENKYAYNINNLLLHYTSYALFKLNLSPTFNNNKCEEIELNELFILHSYIMQSNEPIDLLGYIMMGGNKRGTKGYKGNSKTGQFFTDSKITDMLAELSLCKLKYKLKNHQTKRIFEPSAGTGSMIISIVKTIRNKKDDFYSLENFLFTTIELDRNTCSMLLLQMALLDINIHVVNGNTIEKTIFNEWKMQPLTNTVPVEEIEIIEEKHEDHILGGLFAI